MLPKTLRRRVVVKPTPENASEEPISCRVREVFSRKGRPSHAMVGHVEERILDAATRVFIQHGYAGASLERIAEAAGAGKATLYSRYSGKEALFLDVVARKSEQSLRLAFETPQQSSLADRVSTVTMLLVTRLVNDDVIGLMRMVMADAPRFPSLVTLMSEAGRMRGIEVLAQVIDGYSQSPGDIRVCRSRKRRSREIAAVMLDAVVSPIILRSLMGENLDDVRSDIDSHVKQMIALFIAANVFDAFL